jgi:hypothetical protein
MISIWRNVMFGKKLYFLALTCACLIAPLAAQAYIPYDSHVFFLDAITRDLEQIIPRAMGEYVFQNRYDFGRGLTFIERDIRRSPHKPKDLEEIRREAYERLMRDIPYVVEALRGGELKLDSANNNVSGRLGMIASSIVLLRLPEFPDVRYLESFRRAFEDSIVEGLTDIWVYYDGYGDFQCLGELMERFKRERTPTMISVRNPLYPVTMKEDTFSFFRAPDKFNRHMIFSTVDINRIYGDMINDIADAFVFIWKCSGMDLSHPSYAAPPGTVVSRPRRGAITTKALPPKAGPGVVRGY